jgi:hypothetical protein
MTVILISTNVASSVVILSLESGSWGYSKIEDFFLLVDISGATDCRLYFCWIVIVNVVSDSKFLRKNRKYLYESDRRSLCWWNAIATGVFNGVLFIMLYWSKAD